MGHLELFTIFGMISPLSLPASLKFHQALGHKVPHHGHQIQAAKHLDLGDGVAFFVIGVGDSFDLALEVGEHGLKPGLLAVMGILIP